MKYIRVFAFIFTLFLLISVGSAEFEDTFQNHPSNDEEQVYSGHEEILWSSETVGTSYVNLPQNYLTYNRILSLRSGRSGLPGAYATTVSVYPDETEYYSFVVRGYGLGTWGGTSVTLYDIYGNQVASGSLAAALGTYQNNDLYEILYSTGNILLYVNGVFQYSLGSCTGTPAYIRFTSSGGRTDAGTVNYVYIDDVSIDGYVLGIGTDESPETWVNTASNNEIDVEWSVKTIDPYGMWNDTEVYQIITTWIDTGTVVNTTTLNTSTGAKPNGFVIYNRSTLMPVPNYGTYRFDLVKDGITVESDYLTFLPIGDSGTLSWNQANYVPYDNASVTYQYGAFDASNYNYFIKTYEINTGLVDTQTITAISDTITIPLTAWESGSYYSLLSRVTKADSSEIFLAFDVFNVNDEIKFAGLTYDAENGVILNSTYVDFIQATSWYNTTSSATTASYTLTGLSKLIQITLNASKTNFTHDAFTFTPPVTKLYTTNLYLFPTNRTLNGSSIVEGMTVDSPLHQALGSSTVHIYNDTWSNTTTSNAFGYYQFNLSLENGTYTLNATKTGYTDSDEYSIIVTKNQSVVKNIVLPKQYTLTVKATDSTSRAYISTFIATVGGTAISVTDGDAATFILDWGLYTVSVSATDYYAGSTNILLQSDDNATVSLTRILSAYYDPAHNVKYTVWGFGGYYQDINVNVYKYGETDTTFTGVTGTDGVVTFDMNETQRYRLTFINAIQGIHKELIHYPVDDSYIIFISSVKPWTEHEISINEAIDIVVSTSIINSSVTYVNVSYIDHLSQTTAATVHLNQSNISDPHNQTIISSQAGLSGNWTHSFIVSPYKGESYYVHVLATHTTYGLIDKTFTASFKDSVLLELDGIPAKFFLYLAMFSMVYIGAMFGAQSVAQGSMMVCVAGWFFFFMGWFDVVGNTSVFAVGLGFATVISIVTNLNKYNRKEGLE